MYLNDDQKTAKVGDRLIACLIGGVCGYLLGGFVTFPVFWLFGSYFYLPAITAAGFAVYAYSAPSSSTLLWTDIWSKAIEISNKVLPIWRR
jgi:hypothetical protein